MTEKIDIGIDTGTSHKELGDLAKAVNDFTTKVASASGKKVRLLNLTDDIAELKELIQLWKEVITLHKSIQGPLNAVGQGVGNRPATPMQIDQTLRQNQQYMEKAMSRLLLHSLNAGKSPVNTGLTAEELTGRPVVRGSTPGIPDVRHRDTFFGGTSPAARHLAAQVLSGTSGGVGGAAGSMAAGAARGLGAFAGGGMAGLAAGAGIGLLGYGLYKGASALSDGVDRNKAEAVDIDKFRRSLGGMAESFEKLRDKSRLIGDQFNLTYVESRKVSTEFATIARTNKGAVDQASEGVGMALAVGAEPAQGADFMANLRRDGAIGDKKSDARMLAIQFAEALKRTGSTLNARDLMTAIQGFSADTSHRGLMAPNIEGFAGMLSAMAGSKTPGLDVANSASILSRADSSFQSGGHMGEASNTLQFMALGGDKVGLLGVKMRQAAGMFATADDVYGNRQSQVNKYLGGSGMTGFGGKQTGLESVMGMFDANMPDKQTRLLAMANHFGLNPEQAATLYNMREEGRGERLTGTMNMANKYKGLVDIQKMSGAGYTTLADIAGADGMGGLQNVRSGLMARSDLSKEQKAQLGAMGGMTDPAALQEALVKFAGTMEREKTKGDQVAADTAKIENSTQRMADGLLDAAVKTNSFLSDIVRALAPNSQSLKDLEADKARVRMAVSGEDVRSGKVSAAEVSAMNSGYIEKLRKPMIRSSGVTGATRMADLEAYYKQMGDKMYLPKDVIDSFPEGEIGAMKKRVDARAKPVDSKLQSGMASSANAEAAIRSAAERAGINPDYAVGVAKLETGLGRKSIKGGGQDTHNLFNIKDFSGGGIRAHDKAEGSFDAYRSYGSYSESADDFVSLLNRKYPEAASAKSPQAFAQGLKSRGYATDPKYVDKLVGVIGSKGTPDHVAPGKVPEGNPQSKSEAKARAEAQRVSLSFAPLNYFAQIDVGSGSGYDRQVQSVRSSGVIKPQATGALT